MPFRYSDDFRKKVVDMVERENSPEEVSEILNISASAIYKWLDLKRKTGEVSPKPSKPNKLPKITDIETFKKMVDENPGLTLIQYAILHEEKTGQKVSRMAIQRRMKSINYTYKKKAFSSKKDLKKKENHISIQSKM